MITYLIITGDYKQYEDALNYMKEKGFYKNPNQYVYIKSVENLLGYHGPTIIEKVRDMLLNEDSTKIRILEVGEYWKNPVYKTQEYKRLKKELTLCEK